MNFHILQLWHAPVLDRSLIYITSVKIYLSPGCYVPSIWMRSLIPGATTGQVTLLLSLSADMTCATSHAIKLLRCHKAWSLMLLTGCASCSCQMWKIKEVPGNSSWPFLPAPPSAAARMGWDVSGSCYCLRKLYNSGVALEKSVWPIRISRAGNVSVKNPRHLHEPPVDKWNRTHHSLFLPGRNEGSVLLWNLIARDPTLPWNRLLLSHALWSGYIYIWGEKSGFEWIVITVITAMGCFLPEFLMCALSSHNLIEFIPIFKWKPVVKWSHMKCLRK